MSAHHARGAWIGAALAVAALAGGCTGASMPDGTGTASSTASTAPTALAPLLPPATSPADLAVDEQVAGALDEEFASDEYSALVSVIVLADGRTVYERYFDSEATKHHHIWSVTKSIISTLVGIAIGEGKIPGVDATLVELLPDRAEEMTPVVAGITLEQLLTMTGGLSDGTPREDDVVASILRMQALDPGTEFHYINNGPHLIAAILAQATGMPVLDYARARLFDPLGIPTTPADQPIFTDFGDLPSPSGFAWLVDAQMTNTGGLGLWLRAQDMAKLGLLYLNDGKWAGHQVVPAGWVRTATREHIPTKDVWLNDSFSRVGYGYLWWTGQVDGVACFVATGSDGQRILVVPDRDIVVVLQSYGGDELALDDVIASRVVRAYRG